METLQDRSCRAPNKGSGCGEDAGSPRTQPCTPGAWGQGEQGAWWPFSPLGSGHSISGEFFLLQEGAGCCALRPIPFAALLPPSPSGWKPRDSTSNPGKKLKFTLQIQPLHGTLRWLGAALLQALTGNPQSQKENAAVPLGVLGGEPAAPSVEWPLLELAAVQVPLRVPVQKGWFLSKEHCSKSCSSGRGRQMQSRRCFHLCFANSLRV